MEVDLVYVCQRLNNNLSNTRVHAKPLEIRVKLDYSTAQHEPGLHTVIPSQSFIKCLKTCIAW